MKAKTGYKRIKKLSGKRIGQVAPVNKGGAGQALMTAIGLPNDPRPLDFDDGDLKTNQWVDGKPHQTLWISQIQSKLAMFDEGLTFYNSWIYVKIKQFVYVPMHKGRVRDSSANWVIGSPLLINEKLYPLEYKKLSEDFDYISQVIRKAIKDKEELHTTNGTNDFLQIRTKAGKRSDGTYIPMTYKNHQLKDKYMAFYFRKPFLNTIARVD